MCTKPIIALDVPSKEEVSTFLGQMGEGPFAIKIGMELFYNEGPQLVRELKRQGHWIFLDLKLHDIPNTVFRAMRNVATLGVDMVTVHAAGGVEMMQAARDGIEAGTEEGMNRPLVVAVTQLTSTSEEQMQEEQNIQTLLLESVTRYAKLAEQAELDGVVCSAQEVEAILAATRPDFLCVTPGIRPSGKAEADQKRVVSPSKAREVGAAYIVVGRPITTAANPRTAYQEIKEQWEGETNHV